VGGPYEYGVPGAVHGILEPAPATVGAGSTGLSPTDMARAPSQ
jgi:hypothetical protein